MDSVRQHRTIIRALARKDGRLAEAVVLEHALLSGEELAERVEQDLKKETAL